MNTNPNAIRVLCYGDSNTWGKISSPEGKRYPADVRWTGVLQSKLGEGYEVIEEGLGGRTTVLDDSVRGVGKNGKTYLTPCLDSHSPIDIVILALGTNDLKERFNQTPEDIGRNIEELIKIIQGYTKKIILLSPPLVDETVAGVTDNYRGAEEKSELLAPVYQKVAEKNNLEFIDLSKITIPGKLDGYHLDPQSHKNIAEAVLKKII